VTAIASRLTPRATHPGAPIFAASTAVILWGIGPLFVRAIGASGLTVASYRLTFAIPVMFLILTLQGGRMNRRIFLAAAPAGALFAGDIGFSFTAFQHTSIANATLLGALSPLLVLLASGPLFGDRLRNIDYVWFAAAMAGTLLVVLGGEHGGQHSFFGDACAVIAAICWSVYFLNLKQRRLNGVPAFAFMTAIITWAAIVTVPVALVTSHDLGALRGTDFVWLFAMIIGPGAAGHGLMTWATKFINVNVTSLMTLAGPVVSIVGAFVAFDESLSAGQIVGGAVVLGALTMVLLGHRSEQLSPSGQLEGE
jgi:drug/metabolite transporter (DMT)-like permease